MQSDSEHPIFSPVSTNSRNTVYKLRFASLRLPASDANVLLTPKPGARPFLFKQYRNRKNPFQKGTIGHRKPEPLQPSHARTVTEPNRGHPEYPELLCLVHEKLSKFHAFVLSGTGDSQRDSRESIRANRVAIETPVFIAPSGRFARITRISDSRESPDSRESCESIRANHATKLLCYIH